MSELLILEFDSVDEADYAKVNAELGLDPQTGAGDWPAGLVTHVAGLTPGGGACVVEVWESQQAQEEFMTSRLSSAMTAGAVAASKVTWSRVIGHQNPGL